MNKEKLINELNNKIQLVDQALDKFMPDEDKTPSVIHEAMRYSVFAGGKRLRPVLLLTAAEAVGGNSSLAMPAACAMEMIHTYSLVHDDLPAMDNDDFRRGKPTNHKVFGDAFAVLAGDALLTLAFETICQTDPKVPSHITIQVIREIASAAGTMGMIGGQVVDIQSENKNIEKELLHYIHTHKTGALFSASIRTGALIGGATPEQLEKLTDYASYIGLAFQITDDILDVEGDTQKLGKTVGSDERKKKSTYPSLYGLEKSKKLAVEAVEKSLYCLRDFDEKADLLRYVAEHMSYRDR